MKFGLTVHYDHDSNGQATDIMNGESIFSINIGGQKQHAFGFDRSLNLRYWFKRSKGLLCGA